MRWRVSVRFTCFIHEHAASYSRVWCHSHGSSREADVILMTLCLGAVASLCMATLLFLNEQGFSCKILDKFFLGTGGAKSLPAFWSTKCLNSNKTMTNSLNYGLSSSSAVINCVVTCGMVSVEICILIRKPQFPDLLYPGIFFFLDSVIIICDSRF